MEILAAVVIMIGIISVRVIGFFYPSFLEIKGKQLTEGQKYAIDALAIGILLVTFIIVWTL
ncbi:hypothetical protein [Bacillus sp. N1-1]|uniref:hypothetical protein n=1 Tax=Bacillus sp. N1-1 TaxID=2682541 RepID=UPI0013179867|nr:hypothetical protein [Bacillus sp. N1-1]QHA90783.1 hypothetical protein GNK04_04690 [Bacillus sp. N1-1]